MSQHTQRSLRDTSWMVSTDVFCLEYKHPIILLPTNHCLHQCAVGFSLLIDYRGMNLCPLSFRDTMQYSETSERTGFIKFFTLWLYEFLPGSR